MRYVNLPQCKTPQPPLAQSDKNAPHTLKHTKPSPPFPQTSPGDTNSVFFNPVTPNQTITRGISKSPQVRSKFQSCLHYFYVHQPSYEKVPIFQIA